MKNLREIVAALIVVCVMSCNFLFAQNLVWMDNYVSFSSAFPQEVSVDSYGNCYFFRQRKITKYDPNGTLLWERWVGGGNANKHYQCQTLLNGDVIISGQYTLSESPFDVDATVGVYELTGATSNNPPQDYIVSFNSIGDVNWAVEVDGFVKGIATDNNNNIIIAIDPPSLVLFKILKFDVNGNQIWANNSNTAFTEAQAVTVDDSGVISVLYNQSLFNGATNTYDVSIGVLNLSSGGIQNWNQVYSPINNNTYASSGLTIDCFSDGSIIFGGQLSAALEFNPLPNQVIGGSDGNQKGFVCKLNANGSLSWVKSFLGESIVKSLKASEDNNIYLGGSFKWNIDFDFGPGVYTMNVIGNWDGFVEKIDSASNFQWSERFGADLGNSNLAYEDDISDIDIGGTGFIYGSGWHVQDIGLDSYGLIGDTIFGLSNESESNPVRFKMDLDSCSSLIALGDTVYINSAGPYTWEGNVYNQDGFYSSSYTVASSCDSLIFLELTICAIDNSTTLVGETITANAMGTTYQWLDCNNGFAVLPGETSQSFVATSNGNYAVEINQAGCVDTSGCIAISTIILDINGTNMDSFEFYPNPVYDFLTIELGDEFEEIHFSITNAFGKLVSSKTDCSSKKMIVNMNSLAPGIYFILVEGVDSMQTYKLIKK